MNYSFKKRRRQIFQHLCVLYVLICVLRYYQVFYIFLSLFQLPQQGVSKILDISRVHDFFGFASLFFMPSNIQTSETCFSCILSVFLSTLTSQFVPCLSTPSVFLLHLFLISISLIVPKIRCYTVMLERKLFA